MESNGFNLNDEPIEMMHPFEVDLNCLVIINYKYTLDGLERDENRTMLAAESLGDEGDPEMVSSILDAERRPFDEFRIAARNLAMVALVTRFHHWVSAYARRIDAVRKRGVSLRKELDFLKREIGEGPENASYFLALAEVRNSVIHGDSQRTWDYNGETREVELRYARTPYQVEVSEQDLAEAIQKTVTQIKWYDQKLMSLNK
jgi:hypothetical protein